MLLSADALIIFVFVRLNAPDLFSFGNLGIDPLVDRLFKLCTPALRRIKWLGEFPLPPQSTQMIGVVSDAFAG
jgi:hypothetical protein